MKTTRTFLLLVAALSAALVATNLEAATQFTWAESYGVGSYIGDKPTDDPFYGSGFDFPVAMAKMPDGGYVVAGQLDLPELYNVGYHTSDRSMATLVRFAADGTILWQRLLRQTNNTNVVGTSIPAASHVFQVATDAQGNIFICGGKGNADNSGVVPFVAKFSPAGDLVWQNGIGGASATIGDPPQTVPLGVGATAYMSLTNDGGVVITLSQSRPNVGYSIPVLAKFDANGALALYKAYDNQIQYLGTTPVCQSNDGSRYVMAFLYATDGSALGTRYGLLLLVTDAAGNIVAQRGYNHSDAPGETPVAIVATADGGFATLSTLPDYAGGILRKFNSDLSAEVFKKFIRPASGHSQHLATNSLLATADGGFLVGGETTQDDQSSSYDVMLMKLSSSGGLQFVSLLGGPRNDGGPTSTGPSSAFAIEMADGGYGLAATSGSYNTGGAVGGGFYYKPDWWMAKTDANRKVRNFIGTMIDKPLDAFSLTGSPEVGANPSEFRPPAYPYGASTTIEPQFIIQDPGAKTPPNQPTIAIQGSSPRIVSSRTAEAVVGQHFAYHITNAFFNPGATLTYSASGLPQGFVFDPKTGVISGVPPTGSETTSPIIITLQVTDGVDTASATLSLTIGDGIPAFTVNGSGQPTANVADPVLSFLTRYPGKRAGRVVTVQTATDSQGPWTNLDSGLGGYMTYDFSTDAYVLNSTNYPQQNGIFFRARVKADGFPDVFSNSVGSFNLASAKARAGRTVFRIRRNGVRADFDFRVTEVSPVAGIALRVQTSKTPSVEGSWTDLKDSAGSNVSAMKPDGDSIHFALLTQSLPEGGGNYFRAIAAGPANSGIIDSISNVIGSYTIQSIKPPTVTVTSPPRPLPTPSAADPCHTTETCPGERNNPVVITVDAGGVAAINIHANATAGPNRGIASLSILFDGEPIYAIQSSSASASIDYQKNTNVIGDHVIEAIAFDDKGVTARAGTGPLYIRIIPSVTTNAAGNAAATSTGGIVYHVVNNNGYWRNPTTWQDSQGNNGVPRENDFAIIGASTILFEDNGAGLDVGSISMNGGHIYGNSSLAVKGIATIAGGSFENGMSLIIRSGAVLELLNSSTFRFTASADGVFGTLLNSGTINIHGAGGLTGVADFKTFGPLNFQVPLLSSSAAAALLGPDPRAFAAAVVHDNGKVSVQSLIQLNSAALIGNDGASLIGNDGASLIGNDGGSLISQDGGSIVATGGGNLIGNDGASLIGNDGASLIGNDGASLIGNDGASLIGNDGASAISHDGGSFKVGAANGASATNIHAASAESGYIKQGGEIDTSNLVIVGPVSLNAGVLNGSGLIIGDLTNNGGYITPGHSPGSLAVLGNFSQGSGGTIVLEAAGAESGQFDRLQIAGAATLGGRLDLRTINGYVPLPNDPLNPLGFKSVSGSFSSISSNAQVAVNATGLTSVIDPAAPNPSTGQPLNIATRMSVQTGDNVLIAGFIVTGPSGSTKKVLIRGMGPSLAQFGVPGTLSDPFLELHQSDGTVTNDNWQEGDTSQIPDGFAPGDPRESVIVATLTPGNYSAVLKGAHGETGIGIAEVYDLDSASPAKLANISTRGFINTDDNVMIGGFIIGGNEPAKILVRAIGPTLTDIGVPGALADPTLELHDANGSTISNDDWRETQESEIIATTIPPNKDREPAILATLVPGNYTAIVRGKNNTTGIGLVEAYNLQ